MSDEITTLSFEKALEDLDGLIAKLEGGQIPLSDAVEAYKRGSELAAHCGALLDRTEATITQLVSGPAGSVEVPLTTEAQVSGGVPRARSAGLFAASGDPIDPEDVPF